MPRDLNRLLGTIAVAAGLAIGAPGSVAFAQAGIGSLRGLNSDSTLKPTAIVLSPEQKDLRRKLAEGRSLTNAQLRELADLGEGIAAFEYGKRLEATGNAGLLGDAVHYYAIAAYGGRDFAVRRLCDILGDGSITLSDSQRRSARDALARQANHGNETAAVGLSAMLIRGAPFGQDVQAGREYLVGVARRGSGKSAVDLALSYMNDAPQDIERARKSLEWALASDDLSSRAVAASLMLRLPKPPTVAVLARGEADPPAIRPRPRPDQPITSRLSSDQGVSQ